MRATNAFVLENLLLVVFVYLVITAHLAQEFLCHANQIGRSSCFVCPGRHYCPLGTENFADYPCPTGYYCPNGTKFSSEYPCPPGTYSNVTHLLSAEDCTPCPPGHYCSGEELTSPSGLCNPSFYCTLSSPVPSPANNSSYGGPCLPGF